MTLSLFGTVPIISKGFQFTQNTYAQFCQGHPACQGGFYNRSTCRIYLDAPTGARQLNSRHFDEMRGPYTRTAGSIDGQSCYRADRRYMLQGFRFNTRGGHKISKIGFIQSSLGGSVSYSFHDQDANDFADGYVWLKATPRGSSTIRTVIRNGCLGECFINLGSIENGRQIALAGFSFRRKEGDGHVRRSAIMPQLGAGTTNFGYMVAFQDDDFEYDVTIQYYVLPAGTLERQRFETRAMRRIIMAAQFSMLQHRDVVWWRQVWQLRIFNEPRFC